MAKSLFEVKYYIYISDTKLDMLYPQIPKKILERISGELNIKLGMININLKNKESDTSRFDKLVQNIWIDASVLVLAPPSNSKNT